MLLAAESRSVVTLDCAAIDGQDYRCLLVPNAVPLHIFPRHMLKTNRLLTASVALVMTSHPLAAQTRGFVVRLGTDTFAVERISRSGNTVTGAVARHTPTASVLRYLLTFKADGSVATYTESISKPDGTPMPVPSPAGPMTDMKMTFVGDTIVREVVQGGTRVVQRDAMRGVVLPFVGGTSPYWQELAIQAVQRAKAAEFGSFGFGLAQHAPSVFPVRFVSRDSAEIPLGQGFFRGYRLDGGGQLLHGDASNTTVRLQMTPIHDADIDAIARGWAAQEAVGQGMGSPSTRDTARFVVGRASATIDYGRPAKRGRAIWGQLVPFDTVWRLGANLPTQLHTDGDIQFGGITVAAGTYSLWLVPSQQQSYLLVNTQTSGWIGVPMHDAAKDVTKIPVAKHVGLPAGEERFRILVQDGTLMMLWDDGGYEVPLRAMP